MYRPLTNQQNFRVSLLNRNFEGAVILQLVLFTQNSISVEALRVRVNVKLSQMFMSDTWAQSTTTAATSYHNSL